VNRSAASENVVGGALAVLVRRTGRRAGAMVESVVAVASAPSPPSLLRASSWRIMAPSSSSSSSRISLAESASAAAGISGVAAVGGTFGTTAGTAGSGTRSKQNRTPWGSCRFLEVGAERVILSSGHEIMVTSA